MKSNNICHICNSNFDNRVCYNIHLSTKLHKFNESCILSNRIDIYNCELCNLRFYNVRLLRVHRKSVLHRKNILKLKVKPESIQSNIDADYKIYLIDKILEIIAGF